MEKLGMQKRLESKGKHKDPWVHTDNWQIMKINRVIRWKNWVNEWENWVNGIAKPCKNIGKTKENARVRGI